MINDKLSNKTMAEIKEAKQRVKNGEYYSEQKAKKILKI
tara:strand:+ start:3371 stop:3487 length:117 start_codon:yes stop_codon:yes gene_type:complete